MRAHAASESVAILICLVLVAVSVVLGRRALLRLPSDFLLTTPSPSSRTFKAPYGLRTVVGVALMLLGVLLLFLPGPGLVFLATGAAISDFQWPIRALRWLMGRTPILQRINHLRERHGQAPLLAHDLRSHA